MGLMSHAKVVESNDQAVLDVPVDYHRQIRSSRHCFRQLGARRVCSRRKRFEQSGDPALPFERHRSRSAVEQSFKSGDQEIPAGSLIFPASSYDKLKAAVEPLGLKAIALSAAPTVPAHDVDLPRLAVFSTWGSTQEVGWVRYAFDKFEVPFDLIYKERIKQGNLRCSYDVIVIPNQGRGSKGLVYDIEAKAKPMPYKKSDEFKTLGMYGESDDITGGMGLEGVVELQKFVEQGGLMITLGTASSFPADFGITRKVEAARTSASVLCARPDRASGDHAAGASCLLRLYRKRTAGALGERSFIDGSHRRPRIAGVDAVPRRAISRCSAA